MFTDAFPIIHTSELPRALGFYRDLLDGEVVYRFPEEGEPGFVAMDIGSSHLGIAYVEDLEAAAGHRRFALWVYAEDCDAAVERLRAGGAPITAEPADQPWGERMARALDPDGNEVIVGQRAGAG